MGNDKLGNLDSDDLDYTILFARERKILIVDDEPVIHAVFEDLLEDEGYQLAFVSSAEKALERLKSETYDIAIVDKNLPEMSGLELMGVLRGSRVDLEFIMMTGYSTFEATNEALRLGAIDYLEKPFKDLELVKTKIRRSLEQLYLADKNRVLADHLRDAHREFFRVMAVLDDSILQKAIHALKTQNTELARAIDGVLDILDVARARLDHFMPPDDTESHVDSQLLERAQDTLSVQIQKLKSIR